MIYVRRTKNGEIKQTLIVNNTLLTYYPGEAPTDYTSAIEVHSPIEMRDVLNDYRSQGFILRNMAESKRIRKRTPKEKTNSKRKKNETRRKANVPYFGDDILPFM